MKYKVNKKRPFYTSDTGCDVGNTYINELCPVATEDAINDLDRRIQRHEDEVKGPVKKIKELEKRIKELENHIKHLIPMINSSYNSTKPRLF